MTHKHHIGGRTVRSETTLFFLQDPHALAVRAKAVSDKSSAVSSRHALQAICPSVAALCPIILLMEYHDDGIFPPLRHLASPLNTNVDIEQSPAQGGITVEGTLEQLNGDSVRPDRRTVRQRADGVCQLLHRTLNS